MDNYYRLFTAHDVFATVFRNIVIGNEKGLVEDLISRPVPRVESAKALNA